MRRLATLLMFMWLIAASCGAAEPPGRDDLSDPVFQRADLPEPVFLTAMAQDNNGFFWLGTQNGLFLWDGYRFHGVPVDPSRRDALADGFINVLHKDRQGRLWVGMAAGGLARLDPVTGKPVAVEIGPVGPNHTNVLSMCDDVRDGLLDERAHPAEGFPAPVPEFGDSFRDELGCRLALVRAQCFHVLILKFQYHELRKEVPQAINVFLDRHLTLESQCNSNAWRV